MNKDFNGKNISKFTFYLDTKDLNRCEKPKKPDAKWGADKIAIEEYGPPNVPRGNYHESVLFHTLAPANPTTEYTSSASTPDQGETFEFKAGDAQFDDFCAYIKGSKGKFSFYVFATGTDINVKHTPA